MWLGIKLRHTAETTTQTWPPLEMIQKWVSLSAQFHLRVTTLQSGLVCLFSSMGHGQIPSQPNISPGRANQEKLISYWIIGVELHQKMEKIGLKIVQWNIHLSVIMVSTLQRFFYFTTSHSILASKHFYTSFCIFFSNVSVLYYYLINFFSKSTSGTRLVLVNEAMDYLNAWTYCRENCVDLTTPLYNSALYKNRPALIPSGDHAWIGSSANAQFFWSDGSNFSYKYWDEYPQVFDSKGLMHGVADLQRSGKWSFLLSATLPFVCYSKELRILKGTSVGLWDQKFYNAANIQCFFTLFIF